MEECKCKPAKSYAERIIEYKEFVELVKRMRDAQKALYDTRCKTLSETELCQVRAWAFERVVDEYLKKMEI